MKIFIEEFKKYLKGKANIIYLFSVFITSFIFITFSQHNAVTYSDLRSTFNQLLNTTFFNYIFLGLFSVFIVIKSPLFISNDIKTGVIKLFTHSNLKRKKVLNTRLIANVSFMLFVSIITYFIWSIVFLLKFNDHYSYYLIFRQIPGLLLLSIVYITIASLLVILMSIKFNGNNLIIISGVFIAMLNISNITINKTIKDYEPKVLTETQYNSYIHKTNIYKYVKFIDITTHLRTLFEFTIENSNEGLNNTQSSNVYYTYKKNESNSIIDNTTSITYTPIQANTYFENWILLLGYISLFGFIYSNTMKKYKELDF